ncbi:MAG TPA: GAF domain-containing protein [Anaerolineae bacterium]|nr:GAF domain-containing protein [Anaerolineae bacterium]
MADEREMSFEELRREYQLAQERIAALTVLQDVARNLTSELDLNKLLREILHSAVRVLKASAGSLLLWDEVTNELVFAVTDGGAGEALEGRRMPADKGIAGWVFTHRQPDIVHNVRSNNRFYSTIDESLGYHTSSLVAVPMITKGQGVGVLEVLNKKSGERFDENDRDILYALAGQAAIAVVNARLYQEIRDEKDRIIALEEDVRKELARDFHDGPAQTLAAMIMGIELLETLPEQVSESVAEGLAELRSMATKTLHQVRNMIFELRPVILKTQGLEPALRSYVERLREAEDMNIHLKVEGLEERLPARLEEICFSIIQEAISNVKRHANEKNVWLTAVRRGDEFQVVIKDDGEGFDLAEVERSYDRQGKLGLLNMRERAEMIGGRLSIESAPGEGTTITLDVPLSP